MPGHFAGEIGEHRALLLDALDAEDPQIASIAGEIAARLLEQGGDGLQARGQLRRLRGRERKRVLPQLHRAERLRSLARWLVALFVEEGRVEGGIPRPRPQHAMVEVEA